MAGKMIKMRDIYKEVCEEFVARVNKEFGDTYKIAVASSDENAKLPSSGLTLSYTSTSNASSAYGFFMSPFVMREGNITSLAYSSHATSNSAIHGRFRDSAPHYMKSKLGQDDIDNIARYTARAFNQYGYFGPMFEGYEYDQNMKDRLVARNAPLEDYDKWLYQARDRSHDGRSDSTDVNYAIIDAVETIYGKDTAKQMLYEEAGFDKLYQVIRETAKYERNVNPGNGHYDLFTAIAGNRDNNGNVVVTKDNEQAMRALTMLSVYSHAVYQTLTAESNLTPEQKKSGDVYADEVFVTNVGSINYARNNAKDNYDGYNMAVSETVGTDEHCYHKYVLSNSTAFKATAYAETDPLSYTDNYRLFRYANDESLTDKAVNVPDMSFDINENGHIEVISGEQSKSLRSLLRPNQKNSAEIALSKTFLEGFPCIAEMSDYKSVDEMENIFKKVFDTQYNYLHKNQGLDDKTAMDPQDVLAVEFRCFSDLIKNDDSVSVARFKDLVNDFEAARDNNGVRKAISDAETGHATQFYNYTVRHEISIPSVEKGTLEFGKRVMEDLGMDKQSGEKQSQNVARAMKFRHEDRAYDALDKVRDAHPGSDFTEIIRDNPEGFESTSAYSRGYAHFKEIVINSSSEDTVKAVSQLNDFLMMTDVYNAKSEKAIGAIVNDIAHAYDGDDKTHAGIYRPQNKNEVAVLREFFKDHPEMFEKNAADKPEDTTVVGYIGNFEMTVKELTADAARHGYDLTNVKSELQSASSQNDTFLHHEYSDLYEMVNKVTEHVEKQASKMTSYDKLLFEANKSRDEDEEQVDGRDITD